MARSWQSRQMRRLAPLIGLLLANGCLANFENNFDLLLAPSAFDNALVLPFREIARLAYFLFRVG